MKRAFLIALAAATAVVSAVIDARAQAKPSSADVVTELVVGDPSPDDPFESWIGLRIRLGAGWKTYWKAPGDAGLPPEFDWSASYNLTKAEVFWPVPHRTAILGVESLGYTGEVLLPIKVQSEDPDDDTKLELKLVLYACSTICIREERVLKADLAHPSSADAQAVIDEWRSQVPKERSASLSIHSIALLRSTPPKLQVEASSAIPFGHPDLFAAGIGAAYLQKPEIETAGDRAVLTAVVQGDLPASLDPSNVRVVLADGDRAVEAAMAAAPAVLPASAGVSGSWLAIIVTALLGGLILNLMPCVFPVLSLKLIAFANPGAAELRLLRPALVASAAGVISSFLVLATALALLKAGGASIGWGVQFQHPLFLTAMAVAITLFAANLLGFFEIALPWGLANRLARPGLRNSVASHFASGFVATLLATPCSAPFVGTAVGFALARGAPEIYGVFTALGAGMAMPYLLAACIPNLARYLPRPGSWMVWLRRAMGMTLLATAAWLVTLVGATAGFLPAALVGVALCLGLFLLWWRSAVPSLEAIVMVYSVMLLAAAVSVAMVTRTTRLVPAEGRAIAWHDFGELDGLVRSGRTVFLDVTAAWCVTCKVNKALVINDRAISQRLLSDVVAVRGDWTKPDPIIAEYLKSYGRYGLPFNVVFGPGAPGGIVLPELLTKNTVLAAFDRSSAAASSDNQPK